MLHRIRSLMAILTLLAGAVAWSQETRGTITGRVTDPSGAVIPGATVVVTNTAMGTKTNISTNQDGIYQAPFLIPGMYQVEAVSAGFKQAVRGNIELRVADRLEVNLELQIGASDQSVTVTAETPLLNSETASVGTVVDSKRVADLPLSYGNPFELIGAAAGVAFTGDARLDRPFEPTHIVGYAMAGSRGNLGDVTLDGAPTTATANGNQVIASYVPPTDIVQEFKVQTATFDAQFGQTQGGVTNISMKSGTNQFHGTGGYTVQRPSFWANDFFNNQQGKPRPDGAERSAAQSSSPKSTTAGTRRSSSGATRASTIRARATTTAPTPSPLRRRRPATSRPCFRCRAPGRVTRSTTRSRAERPPAVATRRIRSRATSSPRRSSIRWV